jgi:hypothetical protein
MQPDPLVWIPRPRRIERLEVFLGRATRLGSGVVLTSGCRRRTGAIHRGSLHFAVVVSACFRLVRKRLGGRGLEGACLRALHQACGCGWWPLPTSRVPLPGRVLGLSLPEVASMARAIYFVCKHKPRRRLRCPKCRRHVGARCCWAKRGDVGCCVACVAKETEPEPEPEPVKKRTAAHLGR